MYSCHKINKPEQYCWSVRFTIFFLVFWIGKYFEPKAKSEVLIVINFMTFSSIEFIPFFVPRKNAHKLFGCSFDWLSFYASAYIKILVCRMKIGFISFGLSDNLIVFIELLSFFVCVCVANNGEQTVTSRDDTVKSGNH